MVSSNQETGADSFERYYLQEAETVHDDNKFVIKLKTPKSDEEVEQGETASSVVKKEHYCSDCKKSFSSGKALGGHMSSAHVQAGKDYPSKRFRMKNSNKFRQHGSVYSNGFGGEGGIICGICGKNFPTRKSLYGHMRCHPDRDYRGMQPPESKKIRQSSPSDQVVEPPLKEVKDDSPQRSAPSSQSDADDQDGDGDNHDDGADETLGTHPPVNKDSTTDLSRFLRRWAVTGQRGRQSNNPDMVSASDQSPRPRGQVEQLSDAAYSLVSLSSGIRRRYEEEEEEEEEDRSDSMTPDGEIVDPGSMNLYVAKEAKELQEKPKRLCKRKRNSGDDCYGDERRASKKDQRQFTPVKKLIIGERKPGRQVLKPSLYEGKGKAPMEPKFEKLVGAIYKSGNSVYKSSDDDDSERTPESQDQEYFEYKRSKMSGFGPCKKRIEKDENELEEKPLSTEVAEKESTPEKYKCSTCKKGFTTHQALGGHRSSHNKLRVSIQNNANDSSSPENQSNCNIISRFLLDSGFKLAENPHQCQICNKIFSSGQALGGHMRCHTNAPSSQADESSQEDIRSVKKVLDFDLNELPDMDDQSWEELKKMNA